MAKCNTAQGQLAKFIFVINLGYWLSTNSNKHFPKRWLLGQRFSTPMMTPAFLNVACISPIILSTGLGIDILYTYNIYMRAPTQPWHAFRNVMDNAYTSSYNTHALLFIQVSILTHKPISHTHFHSHSRLRSSFCSLGCSLFG